MEDKTLKSGELAKRTGVSVDTLYHYEKMGVLQPPDRQDNGYRVYPPGSPERVLLIRKALDVGFTLSELAPFLKARDAEEAPCKEVQKLAKAKLKQIEAQLEALQSLKTELSGLISSWELWLASTPHGQQARLLEGLVSPNVSFRDSRKTRLNARRKPKESE